MYDVILVGGGSAGCVLANRLSADGERRVLLLEAGAPDDRAEIHIPAAFSKLFQSDLDWNYHTVPQEHLGGRSLYWPRGRVLGGSSSINAMIYIRGHHADYDGWAAAGCEGWSYSDVLPYFKRSEDWAGGPSPYHGTGGELRVEPPRSPSAFGRAFVDAATHSGVQRNPDFNGAVQDGVGFYDLTQRGGRRESAARAFLKPALRRPNLTVETGAHATRVLVECGRAVGVAYRQGGQALEARTDGEVVVCGGAVNSPQLLMLSGIGDADHLAGHGIDVVADRPAVGQNLQDHLIVGLRYRMTSGSLLDAESPLNILSYLAFRKGMLTSNIAEVGLFTHTRGGESAPDVQFHVAPVLFEDHGLTPPTEHGFSIGPTGVRPRSRGAVTLATADAGDHPRIDPNYLADGADLDSLVEGIKLGREIAHQAALEPFRGAELSPGADLTTDAQLADYVRANCETLYHPVGTCRMGPDADAVVDLDLRVRGVDGLRVVDASVMPTVPNGNTNAPTIMIAERAADLILGDAARVPAQAAEAS